MALWRVTPSSTTAPAIPPTTTPPIAPKDEEDRKHYTAAYALSKIDVPSILFFFGILLAVGSLEATHILKDLALWLDQTVGNMDLIIMIIGVASAIVDNVPIVAAAILLIQFDSLWKKEYKRSNKPHR